MTTSTIVTGTIRVDGKPGCRVTGLVVNSTDGLPLENGTLLLEVTGKDVRHIVIRDGLHTEIGPGTFHALACDLEMRA